MHAEGSTRGRRGDLARAFVGHVTTHAPQAVQFGDTATVIGRTRIPWE